MYVQLKVILHLPPTMFKLDKIYIHQFIYFCSNLLVFGHKLLDPKPHYDLQSDRLCFRHNWEKKSHKSRNQKWSLTESIRVSLCKFYNKTFGGFRENGSFLKRCLYTYLKSLQSFRKCFPDLDSYGLVFLTNVGLIACKRFKQGFIGELTVIHVWNNSSTAKFDLLYIFKFRFSWAPEKILKDTKFEGLINKSR